MPYQMSVPLSGDAAAALDAARTILLGQGFVVNRPRPDRLEAAGSWVSSSQHAALRGVASLQIEARGSTLSLTASMRNAIAMILFILLFPPALILVIGLVQHTSAPIRQMILPWVFIGPAVSVWIWFRTTLAIRNLLRNMQNAARPEPEQHR